MKIWIDETTNLDAVLSTLRRKLVSSGEADIEFAVLEFAAREFQERLRDLGKKGVRTELTKKLSIAGKAVTLSARTKRSGVVLATLRRVFGG